MRLVIGREKEPIVSLRFRAVSEATDTQLVKLQPLVTGFIEER